MATELIHRVYDELLANADFEEQGSLSKAKLFASAAKRWLILQPEEQRDQHNEVVFNNAEIERLLARAQAYIAANSGGNNVRYFSASNFR